MPAEPLSMENRQFRLSLDGSGDWLERVLACLKEELAADEFPLRFSISEVSSQGALIESTVVRCPKADRFSERLCADAIEEPRAKRFQSGPFCVVQVIPTGVCCEYGGFAGDATPVTNLLAAVADLLVTHPNAVNASDLNEMAENVLYVEGRSLDDFLLGNLALRRVTSNRIGTLVDPTGKDRLGSVIEVIDAAAAVAGMDCDSYALLNQEAGLSIDWSESGCAVGHVGSPGAILRGVEHLLASGMDAVGCISVIAGVSQTLFDRHLDGKLPNPSGGVEAIVTHLISTVFRIPTAHAPLPYYDSIKERTCENPRAAAEFVSIPHYFSVLKGLARAPRLVPLTDLESVPADLLSLNNVGAIVAPASCLGGVPALAAQFSGIPLIAVRENCTVLDVTNEKMGMDNVIEVDTYLEAAGVVVALRNGIALRSLKRPIGSARRLEIPLDQARS